MPNLRSSKIVPLGLLIGVGFAVLIYFSQQLMLFPLVYTTYLPLIDSLQLYELAWIMATIDLLLNMSFQLSLFLWLGIAIIIALTLRNLNITLSTLSAAILLPAGTWLLFAFKYLYLSGFSISFLLSFLIWQTLFPLGITLGLATLVTLPFIVYRRQKPPPSEAPTTVQSTCTNCGTVYQSQPLICVQCGKEGTITTKLENES